MSKPRRLRIFAGPNGSGKSTLYEDLKTRFNTGVFINADNIEKEISSNGFLDLKVYGLHLSQRDLSNFLATPNALSLIEKAKRDGYNINIKIKENIIIVSSKDTHSYEASLITAFIREYLLKNKSSFCFESVMSHPSKIAEIKEAKQQGYKIYLYFVCVDAPSVNVSRVQNRVQKGGHSVSPDKVKSRYTKTLENLLPLLRVVDRAYLIDNSNDMTIIAELEDGKFTLKEDGDNLPNWFIEYVINANEKS